MKYQAFILFLVGTAANNVERSRDGKVFGLFSIVSFENDQCTTASSSTTRGTCLSETECRDAGGAIDGSCAAGFGVCCLFRISTCGSSVSRNCTYIQNPDFPSPFSSTSTSCAHTVDRFAANVCQLRLDFDTLMTAAPPVTTGSCETNDKLVVTQSTGGELPILCGTLTGQHVYIEAGTSGSMGSIAFTIGATTATRQWNIKVTAIECTSPVRAPEDCLQYHTGSSGTISSFNQAGGSLLQAQQYQICIRQEAGYCQISYATNAGTTPDSFLLNDMADAAKTVVACPNSYVAIPLVAGASNTICGGIFCDADTGILPCRLTTDVPPFVVEVFSKNAAANALTGFKLDYSQVPCANTATD